MEHEMELQQGLGGMEAFRLSRFGAQGLGLMALLKQSTGGWLSGIMTCIGLRTWYLTEAVLPTC